MHPAQAIRKFATVPLEGWNGAAWMPTGVKGDFLSYDRFITHRTFGAMKRLFTAPIPLPPQWELVRTPDGTVFLASFENIDIEGVSPYGYHYLLHQVNFTAQVIGLVATPSASGMAGSTTEVVLATVRCDAERVTAERSLEFNTVKYTQVLFALPRSAPVTEDTEIKMDGRYYRIKEVFLELGILRAVGAKR